MTHEDRIDIFELQMLLDETVGETEERFPEENILLQQWEVARETGKMLLKHRFGKIIQENYHLSETELFEKWNDFIDSAYKTSQDLLADLQILPPDTIQVEYLSERENVVASMSLSPDGETKLKLHAIPLVQFFVRLFSTQHEFQRVNAKYEFEKTLAHEFRHLYQYRNYPNVAKQTHEKGTEYFKRKNEYDARVYSLHWLRKRREKSLSGKAGLYLARTGAIIEDIDPFLPVRDQVNEKFGVPKPGLIDALKAIFTGL